MEITYKNKNIQKFCTDIDYADKRLGTEMTNKIHMRIDQIRAVDSVETMLQNRIGRCHSLHNNRKGQYAVDLIHPYRLIFEVNGRQIQIANIMEIVDYH